MATSENLEAAASLAAAGRWAAARAAYAAALNDHETADGHLGLARAAWWLGDTGRARDEAERAFAAFEDESRHADAAMAGVVLCIWYLTNFDNPAAANGWLSRARHAAALSEDRRVSGWVTLVSGYFAADRAEGRRLMESAATTADSLSDRDLSAMALADLGLWHVSAGEVDRGMAMLDEALAATFAEPRGMLEVVVWSSCDMLAACSMVDDLRRATQWCRVADRFMETYGCPFLQARCRAHYGTVLLAAGRWDEAERELRQALAMAADTGREPRIEALTALAELHRRRGRPEIALELLDEADDATAGAAVRAGCLSDLGRHTEALAVLRSQFALRLPTGPEAPPLVSALVEAAIGAGRLQDAADEVRRDQPIWHTPVFPRGDGLLARAAGQVAAANHDLAAARAHFGFALDVFTRLQLPFEAAQTELDLARLFRTDDAEAAVGRARTAHTRLQQLGARRHVAEAATVLRSLGVTPPPGRRTADALSERERDVLTLLAGGLSNPDIAERLFLSRRTVGHHVSSILRKLNLSSRAEAAAFAAREGPARR